MKKYLLVAPALLAAAALALPGMVQAQTFRASKFSIGGEGGHDYIVAEPGTGRVFISRGTHFMVVDGATGKLLGDIADTPGTHGVALVPKWNRGFTSNSGDGTLTMFDLKTLAPVRKVPIAGGGLDGIMYDAFDDRVILTNHSRPDGTAIAVDANSGAITGTVKLNGDAPEGAASDGKGRLFINNEDTSSIQVIDGKTMHVLATWPIAPCEGPTGIAYDAASNRIFSGCSNMSVAVDAATGKVVASIANGDGVDAIGWDGSQKLLYIPAGADGNVTVVHQDSPNKYTRVATVTTMRGGKTIAVDPVKHMAYVFAPEFAPAPAPAANAPAPPEGGRGRGPRGPLVGTWLFAISH